MSIRRCFSLAVILALAVASACASESESSADSMPSMISAVGSGDSLSSSERDTSAPSRRARRRSARAGLLGSEARATLQPPVQFNGTRTELDATAKSVLKEKVAYLESNPTRRIRLVGHADGRGSREENYRAGLARAERVRRALVAAGVDSSRIEVESAGSTQQLCRQPNSTCWAKNRRVEFMLLELSAR